MNWLRRNLVTLGQVGASIIGFLGLFIQLVLLVFWGHPVDTTACTICIGLLLGGPYMVINRIGQPVEPEK